MGDPYRANYTTRPIFLDDDQQTETAKDIEAALEGVPNFAIPNVTVSAPESGKYDVTFVDAGNAGLQANLECSWQGTNTYNKPSSAPRFAASTTIACTKRACAVT